MPINCLFSCIEESLLIRTKASKSLITNDTLFSVPQVTEHLQRVNFRNQFGDNVFFDENGDPPASYDIINWQLRDGQVQHVTLGHFASAASGSYELSVKEGEIVWRTGNTVMK